MSERYVAHEEEYKGLMIKIYPDDCGESPREWDNLCTMVCSHPRYNLGDKPFNAHESSQDLFRALAIEADPRVQDKIEYWENGNGWQSLMNRDQDQAVKWADEKVDEIIRKAVDRYYVYLPLYLYDHSGITIRAGAPFSCPWDSGQVGWIYLSIKRFKEETARAGKLKKDGINHELVKVEHFTKKDRERAIEYLKGETETYDQYLTGEVYGFVIEEDGIDEDSCWGYYGLDECIKEAKDAADYVAEKIAKRERKAQLFNENVLTV